ncbi:hypothetical protein FLAN108750_00985 [Flavobacterium antarcticum]|uniref:hypothetical protein n=1 Tax=Flavobacterium antarcticum TaxID=271155 RepID=UPI0003B54D63|nr:hypothetical protein [Flavobacterium antarcticum]
MAYERSYTITLDNNISEKEAINYLLRTDLNFLNPDKESRKRLLDLNGIDKKYSKAFDLILIPGFTNLNEIIELENFDQIIFIELKTTRKYLPNLPKGFFFGATQNEFDFAELLGSRFQFCFVSINPKSPSYKLLSLLELENIIRTKRIQYQINL